MTKEEIEELGWEFSEFNLDVYIFYKDKIRLNYEPEINHVSIIIPIDKNSGTLYRRTIKTLSEFKELMKELNIE